jgi:mRNA interferase HigB
LRWQRPGSSPTSSVSLLRPIVPRSSPRRHNRNGYQPGLCNKAALRDSMEIRRRFKAPLPFKKLQNSLFIHEFGGQDQGPSSPYDGESRFAFALRLGGFFQDFPLNRSSPALLDKSPFWRLSHSSSVRIITIKRLREYATLHPTIATTLEHWEVLIRRGQFANLLEIRKVLPTADQAEVRSGKTGTIFNIKDHFRLITAIHYNHQIVFILLLLTHGDYDKPHWKKNL